MAPSQDRSPPSHPDLKLERKDYNQYLNNLVFDFALSDECYLFLYRYAGQNFSKRLFKRILTHQGFFKSSLHNEKIAQEIVNICMKQKLNDTFFDFVGMVQELNLQSLTILSKGLASCKHHEPVLLQKFKQFLEKNPLTVTMVGPYVEELIRLKQHKTFMAMFEALKLHQQ